MGPLGDVSQSSEEARVTVTPKIGGGVVGDFMVDVMVMRQQQLVERRLQIIIRVPAKVQV